MKNRLNTILMTIGCTLFAWSSFAQDGGVKVSIITHADGSKTVTKTDPEQHTSEQTTLTEKDKQISRILFKLNGNEQALNGIAYDSKDKPTRKIAYLYDPQNRLSEEQDYSPNDQFLGKFVYEYNQVGKLSRIRAYDANGKEIPGSGVKPGSQ